MTDYALIIDDNALNLDTLALLLKREGIAALALQSTRTLEAALDYAANIKVVFLDLEMPNNDGFAILDALREDGRLNRVPIVAYTVHISEQSTARDAGFHSFIGKPLDVTRFPDQLHRILNGQPVWEVG